MSSASFPRALNGSQKLLEQSASELPAWRVGDWAEVKSLPEIMATLDSRGCSQAMPFMPEMIPYCGKRFPVVKVAHKTCDSSGWEYVRKLENAVHLDLRCDGFCHGGCQAGCLFFWKTAWLRKVEGPLPVVSAEPKLFQNYSIPCPLLENALERAADGELRYRCQATELKHAASVEKPWDISLYVRDLASLNVTPGVLFRHMVFAVLKTVKVSLSQRGGRFLRRFRPAPRRKSIHLPRLDLMPGDKVRIKSRGEIMATLNAERKNFGLLFDPDMTQYCGTVQEVERRVERIIDEETGKMTFFSRDCLILKNVCCTGLNCRTRLFCSRGRYSFWREGWLEKIS